MVYLYGIIGFIGGFAMGLWMIYVLLRAYSRRELVMNKELRWTYGLGVWLLAGLGAWAAVEFYHVYPL